MYLDPNFFQHGPIPSEAMKGTYDYSLVALSYFISVLASYIALDFAARLRTETIKKFRLYWLIGGAVVMGTGIWSMHFIGMLAFTLPVHMYFDASWTAISLLSAILSSGFALFIVRNQQLSHIRLSLAGLFLALGIITMHYAGMEGMQVNLDIFYTYGLFYLSIVIAIVASEAALWLLLHSDEGTIQRQMRFKIFGALIMGAAICGMHYTGMLAAVFVPSALHTEVSVVLIEHHALVPYVFLLSGIVIGIALVFSNYRQLVVMTNTMNNMHLMQDQLLQSEKMATVGQLAAGIAHEVNNPISWILGNLNYMHDNLNKFHEQKFREVIDESIQGGVRIRDIVRDLKVFSRTDATVVEPVDVNEILNSAINMATPSIKYRANIEKNFSNLPKTMANNGKLHQVFLNLIMNAAQAIPEGNLSDNKIFITTQCKNNSIKIDISDTGAGISAENLSHIFEPFFTTKPMGEGTGLGLSICYELIRKLNGKITVHSIVGKGTTFSVHLPLKSE